MPQTVIETSGVSKQYRLGLTGANTLRDEVRGWLLRLRGKDPARHMGVVDGPGAGNGPDGEFHWALRDVSFSAEQGEILGIIGHNGAGKSTLLKILSRVTAPTSGEVRVRGRIASLLEVGTGFHPELTGRENVFMNGAILGMTKSEIRGNFEAIVEFAGIGKFIDTPVKRYSSGMQVRLAFAVAAHLQPEILIVDEVLAVGDAQFQKKCLGRMGEVSQEGRTVLIVSHNLAAISSLCSRAILMKGGRKVDEGPAKQLVSRYIATNAGAGGKVVWDETDPRAKSESFRLTSASVECKGEAVGEVPIGSPFTLNVEFTVRKDGTNASTSIHVIDKHGVVAFVSGTPSRVVSEGTYRHTYAIPANLMNDGFYAVTIFLISDTTRLEVIAREAISLVVYEPEGRSDYLGQIIGCVRPMLEIHEEAL